MKKLKATLNTALPEELDPQLFDRMSTLLYNLLLAKVSHELWYLHSLHSLDWFLRLQVSIYQNWKVWK